MRSFIETVARMSHEIWKAEVIAYSWHFKFYSVSALNKINMSYKLHICFKDKLRDGISFTDEQFELEVKCSHFTRNCLAHDIKDELHGSGQLVNVRHFWFKLTSTVRHLMDVGIFDGRCNKCTGWSWLGSQQVNNKIAKIKLSYSDSDSSILMNISMVLFLWFSKVFTYSSPSISTFVHI